MQSNGLLDESYSLYGVVSSRDILSLLSTAVVTEKPRSATAFPCKIVRDAFAKRERCRNILQTVTSVILDTFIQYVHMFAVISGVKASTSFDAMYCVDETFSK